jgi:HEAT repeat protein
VILAISEAMFDGNDAVHESAFHALKPASKTATPLLIRRIETDEGIALDARHALASFGKIAVGPIVKELELGEPKTWHWGLYEVLGEIGPPAMEAIAGLEKRLNSEDRIGRLRVAAAITRIDPAHKSARRVLIDGLRSPEAEWRLHAAEHLAHTKLPKSRDGLDVLLAFINDKNTNLNHWIRAVVSVAEYGENARPEVEVLARAMKQFRDVPGYRVWIAGAILRIDSTHQESLRILKEHRVEVENTANGRRRSFLREFARALLRDFLSCPPNKSR